MLGALVAVALVLALMGPARAASHRSVSLAGVSHFTTPAAAAKACGKDPVAWANLHARVYHLAGSRWFGKTKHGAYFCKSVLDKKGLRRSKE